LIGPGAVGSLDRHPLQHGHHVTSQFGWISVFREIAFPLCALKATTQRNFAGGAAPGCFLPNGPRREGGIMTGAVGMITSPVQAEHIIRTEQADAVIIAREFLRDPYWPLRAARELDQPIAWPVQYLRAAPKGAQPRVPVDLRSFESCFEEQHGVPER